MKSGTIRYDKGTEGASGLMGWLKRQILTLFSFQAKVIPGQSYQRININTLTLCINSTTTILSYNTF